MPEYILLYNLMVDYNNTIDELSVMGFKVMGLNVAVSNEDQCSQKS